MCHNLHFTQFRAMLTPKEQCHPKLRYPDFQLFGTSLAKNHARPRVVTSQNILAQSVGQCPAYGLRASTHNATFYAWQCAYGQPDNCSTLNVVTYATKLQPEYGIQDCCFYKTGNMEVERTGVGATLLIRIREKLSSNRGSDNGYRDEFRGFTC